jgi:hypothetical protein
VAFRRIFQGFGKELTSNSAKELNHRVSSISLSSHQTILNSRQKTPLHLSISSTFKLIPTLFLHLSLLKYSPMSIFQLIIIVSFLHQFNSSKIQSYRQNRTEQVAPPPHSQPIRSANYRSLNSHFNWLICERQFASDSDSIAYLVRVN